MEDVKSLIGETSAKEEIRNLSEFEKSSQCQSLKLSAHVKANEV